MSAKPQAMTTAPTNAKATTVDAHAMSRHIQQKYLDMENGYARLSIPYNAEFMGNKVSKGMHLGPITAAMDSAAGMSVISTNESFSPHVTLDLRVDSLNPANKKDDIVVECRSYFKEGDLTYVKGTAWQGSSDYEVLTFYSVFMAANMPSFKSDGSTEQAPPLQALNAPKSAIIETMDFVQEAHPLSTIVPYAKDLDLQVGRNEHGDRIVNLPFQPRHVGNPITQALQGGIFLGYLECAGSAYILDLYPKLQQVKSASVFMEYLRAPKPENTYARFSASKVGRRVVNLDITAFQLGRGDVAKASVRYIIE